VSEPVTGEGAGRAPAVSRHGFEIGEIPYPHEIRRFTARAAGARATASPVELLTDLASVVTGALIVVAVTAGVVGRSREALEVSAATGPAAAGTGLQLVVLALAVGAAGAVLSLAARTGPVGVGSPAGQWWLPLAVERRGLVRPAAARTPALAAVAGVLGGAVVVLVLPGTTVVGAATAGLVGGLVAASLVLAAGLAQTVDRQAVVRRVGDGLVVLVAVVLVLAALAGVGDTAPVAPTAAAFVAVVAAAAAAVAVMAVWLDRRLGLLRTSSLRAGGAAGAQAFGGAVSLDLREVGRALTDSSTPSRRRRSLRLRSARGPATALLTGDVVALLRSPWHLVELVVALALPVVVTRVPELATTVPIFVAVVLGGGLASVAAVEPARRAQATPGVDRLLPLAARRVRALRLVLPVVVLLVWSGLVLGAVGATRGAPGEWAALGVLGAPVWAAAGLRAAYRPPPDWQGPLMTTAAGAVPVGVVGVLVHGPDLAALALVPTWVALGLGGVTAPLLVGQAVLAVVAVAVGTSLSTTTLAQRLLGGAGDGETAGAQGLRAPGREREDRA
jgi:hypothetical protein